MDRDRPGARHDPPGRMGAVQGRQQGSAGHQHKEMGMNMEEAMFGKHEPEWPTCWDCDGPATLEVDTTGELYCQRCYDKYPASERQDSITYLKDEEVIA